MSSIDKIRQEIERRLQRENEILWNAKKRGTYPSPSCEYNLLTLTSLRDFIDSLPEEKPLEDLEEEIDKTVNECTDGYKFDWEKFALHFIGLGETKMKKQMMKEAVEGYVTFNCDAQMEKLPERLLKEIEAEALEFDTKHLVSDASGYDIFPGPSFIEGALWILEHFNIHVQYIADGSTSVYGKKENNWKPRI